MTRPHSLIGKTFSRLTVIDRAESDKQGRSRWICECSCGERLVVQGYCLTSGHTQSCGCLQRDVTTCRNVKVNCYVFYQDYCVGSDAMGNTFTIDADDYSEVSKYYWSYNRGYFWRQFPDNLPLHRFLMQPSDGMVIDHIDGIRSNNRRSNLRVCLHAENCRNRRKPRNNSCGYKGVHWDRSIGKWRASVTVNGKHEYIGVFDTPVEAARVYDDKAREAHGEYASLNFPN